MYVCPESASCKACEAAKNGMLKSIFPEIIWVGKTFTLHKEFKTPIT